METEMSNDKHSKEDGGKEHHDDGEEPVINFSDYDCGLFSWRPQWLQKLRSPIYFTLVYLLFGIFQGAMKTGLNSSMTTIERKFGMSGKMVSVIMIMDNITGTAASLIVGYYATKISRPKILVFGVWMSIFGCVFFVLPHLIYGGSGVNTNLPEISKGPEKGGPLTEFCSQKTHLRSNDSFTVSPNGKTSSVALPVQILFSIGNMMNGIGGTAFYIAGVTYADDNVKKKNSPIYFGAILSLRMLGPLLGAIINSYFLTINEHPFHTPGGMSTRDPRWIGAWWLPFVIWGTLMALVSIPLLLFPRNIRRTGQVSRETLSSRRAKPKSLRNKIINDFKDFGSGLKRLLRNNLYVWMCIGYILVMNGLGGLIMNMPKYIETQYRVSAAKAGFLTGATKVFAIIVAMSLGGVAIRIFKPSARAICLWSVLADSLNIAALIIAIYLPCDNWRLGGTSYQADGRLTLLSQCNEACECTRKFQPFCDQTMSKSYYSACYGGCFGSNLTNMDCQCLDSSTPGATLASFPSLDAARFTSGFCRNDCDNMWIFILITTVGNFIATLPRVGGMLVSLRCVDPTDKALALGVGGFVINILGHLPYPLIYGALFDSTCLLWGGQDGKRGNCWYYDNDVLRHRFLGLTVFFYALATGCVIMMSYYAGALRNFYDDEDVTKDGKNRAKSETERMDPKTNRP